MKSRIFSIQYARAFAALSIVIYHTMRKGMLLGYNSHEFNIGKMSVPFFFIISGFIIGYIQDRKRYSVKLFLTHRLIRVMPLYYIFTLVILLIYLVHPSLVYYSHNPNITIWGSFLLYPVENTSMLLNPGWTLRPEIVFYAIFAINLFIDKDNKSRFIPSVIICALLSFSNNITHSMVYEAYFEYLYIFSLGVLIYLFHNKWEANVNGYLLSIISVLAFFIIVYFVCKIDEVNLKSVLLLGLLFYILIINEGMFNNNSLLGKAVYLIGNASFSIYLTHVFAIGVITYIFKYTHLPNEFYSITCVILAIVVGLISYRFIECPILSFIKRVAI